MSNTSDRDLGSFYVTASVLVLFVCGGMAGFVGLWIAVGLGWALVGLGAVAIALAVVLVVLALESGTYRS